MYRLRVAWICAAIISALSLGVQFNANAAGPNRGQQAFKVAKQFAEANNLPHFFVRGNNGVKRIVVNVPQDKWDGWCNVFSAKRHFMEPNFSASSKSKPGWSYLRIGNKHNDRYGAGSECRFSLDSVHFPMKLSVQEFRQTEDKIRNSPNGPWDYNGGNPETTGRNCTNWVTSKISRFTGVNTAAVEAHFGNLMNGYHSDRMTVVGITSSRPLENFTAENNYFIQWEGHHFSAPNPQYHQALNE